MRIPRAAATDYRGLVEPIDFEIQPGRSVLSTLRASLEYDTRDHPWMPTRGWLASAALEISPSTIYRKRQSWEERSRLAS